MSNNAIASILTLIVAFTGVGMIGFSIVDAIKTGEFPFLPRSARRNHEPIAFWFSIAFNAACVVLLVALGMHAAQRLITGS